MQQNSQPVSKLNLQLVAAENDEQSDSSHNDETKPLTQAIDLLRTSLSSESSEDEESPTFDAISYIQIHESYKNYLKRLPECATHRDSSDYYKKLQEFINFSEFRNRWNDDRFTLSPLINSNIEAARFALQTATQNRSNTQAVEINSYKEYLAIALENKKRYKAFKKQINGEK